MSQHDFNIANQTASATRVDLNNALGALASLSSGTTAPTTTFANMLWYETSTNWLWVRNESDTDWIRFAYFNQTTNQLALEDNTDIVNTSGSQTGLLGNQTNATWQAGTSTLNSLVSPNRIRLAIEALNPVTTTSGSAPYFGARAFASFVGSTGNISQQGNVSSITRTGVGSYTVGFSVSMPVSSYSVIATCNDNEYGIADIKTRSTSGFTMQIGNRGSAVIDPSNCFFSVFC